MGQRLALLLAILLAAGCGSDEVQRYPVSGTVTFDGQPVPDGHIIFASPGGETTPDAGPIVDGQYAFDVQSGAKRVEIQASREVPGAPVDPAMGMAPRQEYIPPRYNTQSTLRAEVKPDGENEFNFELKSNSQ